MNNLSNCRNCVFTRIILDWLSQKVKYFKVSLLLAPYVMKSSKTEINAQLFLVFIFIIQNALNNGSVKVKFVQFAEMKYSNERD